MLARIDLRSSLRPVAELLALSASLALLASLVPASWRAHAQAPAHTSAKTTTADASPYSLTLDQIRADARFAHALWLDARRPEDFARKHIPGALLFNEPDWEKNFSALIEHWSPEIPIVVYCDSATCQTSERVAERLRRELGSEEVYALIGGWQNWSPAP